MSARDDHSVFNEPHLRPDAHMPDPSEKKADRVLGKADRSSDYLVKSGQSIHDEPDILPGGGEEIIRQDWHCHHCGFNLRGLSTEQACPHCGKAQLYKPPPPDADSYQAWLKARIEKTSLASGWLIALASIIAGGLFAILGALFSGYFAGTALLNSFIMLGILGPATEEVMKIGLAACIIELSPYRFQRAEQIQVAAIGAALVFAVIENLLYIHVYLENPAPEIIAWRWSICTILHVGCTTIAARGLIRVWKRSVAELRRPKIAQWFLPLTIAIVIHAAYNISALIHALITS